jgi:rhomboid protease GluP
VNQEPRPASQSPESASAPQTVRVATPQSAPYVTYTLLGITIFVYVLQLASLFLLPVDFPAELLKKSNDLIREGQIWRLFTPALVHGSIAHIGFNMYALLSSAPVWKPISVTADSSCYMCWVHSRGT